jgi:hypothetical protein
LFWSSISRSFDSLGTVLISKIVVEGRRGTQHSIGENNQH